MELIQEELQIRNRCRSEETLLCWNILGYVGMNSDSVQKIYLHIFRQMGGCIIMHLCAHVCVLSSICFSALPTEKAAEQ